MNLISNIHAILILDISGNKVLAKYYDNDTSRDTRKYERQLFLKTRTNKSRDEVFMIDNSMVVHRLILDNHIYVVGSREESPLVLDKTLNCFAETINTLITRNSDNGTLHDSIDQIILALDEICDQGMLLEVDPNIVIDRVCLEGGASEQSLAQVLQNAAEIRFPWIRS